MTEAAAGGLLNHLGSEPRMGSRRGGLPETTAISTHDGANLLINGHKTWSTGGRHLTHLLVRATVIDEASEEAGVVLVRRGRRGVPGLPNGSRRGRRAQPGATDSYDAIFRDVVVPRENLIETGDAKPHPMCGSPRCCRPSIWARLWLRATPSFASPWSAYLRRWRRSPPPKIQRQGARLTWCSWRRRLLFEVAESWTGRRDRAAIIPRIAAPSWPWQAAHNEATDKALQAAGGSAITRALP